MLEYYEYKRIGINTREKLLISERNGFFSMGS